MKGKTTIVDTPLGQFALKENKGNSNVYKYLSSRNFEYFPKIIDQDNNSIMFECLEDIDYDNSQKAFDIIHLIALLHSKTTYYKEIDYDEYKNIYEELSQKINYIYNYYLDIINMIESKIYMSPYEYLIARNISKIFACIYYCKNELDNWYELIKNKKRKRVVTLHNNLKLDNLIKNKNMYLIGWENTKIDLPIYDFVNFYNRYALDFDFSILLEEYERIFPLLEEEKKLLNILISIPEKIDMRYSEYNMVKEVRKLLDKIYKTENLLTPKEEERASAQQ
ncbi:MAG: hypothetical protein J6J17_00795 [Bacilli bacterium]|nr:hypothetical protein [Bacilli bacterium]